MPIRGWRRSQIKAGQFRTTLGQSFPARLKKHDECRHIPDSTAERNRRWGEGHDLKLTSNIGGHLGWSASDSTSFPSKNSTSHERSLQLFELLSFPPIARTHFTSP
jgi:hypothetical protein